MKRRSFFSTLFGGAAIVAIPKRPLIALRPALTHNKLPGEIQALIEESRAAVGRSYQRSWDDFYRRTQANNLH